MKRFYVVLILIVAFFYGNSQTQVPNANFENWHTISTSNDSLEGWNAAVFFDVGFPIGVLRIPTAERESVEVFQGNYAVKMETKNMYGFTVPGMMQLGRLLLSDDDLDIVGGIPFADRPLGISFYAKYSPAVSDSAFMFAYSTKYNDATETTDTIGATFYTITETLSDFTQILLPFVYQSDEMPDTLNIIFLSTNPLNMKVGSTLWVDSLQMKYDVDAYPTLAFPATDITDTSFTANWLPSVYSTEYFLDVATDQNFENIIPEFDDLLVNSFAYSVIIPQANQNADNYYYRVRVKYGDTATSVNSNVETVKLAYPTICLSATQITAQSFKANWLSKNLAESYNLQVAKDAEFTDFVLGFENYNLIDTSFVVSGLEPVSDYYYRVQVVYSFATSPFSNIMSLNTLNLKTVDNFTSYYVKNNILFISDLVVNSQIDIFDVLGKNIISLQCNSTSVEIPISVSGTYIVLISNKYKKNSFKFNF